MNILTMPNESTCDGQRKYLHWSSQVLAFFEAVSKKHTKKSKQKRGSLPTEKLPQYFTFYKADYASSETSGFMLV